MLNEFVIMAGLVLAGWAFLSAFGLRGWVVIPLSMMTGICVLVTVGGVFVLTGLPTNALFTWAAACALPWALWCYQNAQNKAVTPNGFHLIATLAIIAVVIALLRDINLVKYHIDTFRYVMPAMLYSSDNLEFMNMNLITKRLLGFPLMLTPSHIYGEHYVVSMVPLYALSGIAIVAGIFLQGTRGVLDRPSRYILVALAIAALATNNRYIWNAFYLNSHLFFGLCIVILAGAGWLRSTAESAENRALLALQLLMLPPLILTRPEGPLFAALAIAPYVLSTATPWRERALVLATYGLATFSWQFYVSYAYVVRGANIPVSAYGPMILGGLALAAAPLLAWRGLQSLYRALLMAGEAVLIGALIVMAARDPDILIVTLDATYQNVILGEGSWGTSLAILAGIAVFVLVFCRDRALIYLRYPITTALPLFLLLAYFRDSPFRVGNGDSLNRMLIQIVPLLVLFIVAAAASGKWRRPFARKVIDPVSKSEL